MKKLLSLIAMLTLSSCASAGFNNGKQGGFNGTAGGKSGTVAQVLKMTQDDAPVQLTGKIVRQIDGDEFIFRDASGEIKIDIDDSAWQGQDVSPKDTITIFGKLDRESFRANEVDVYRVQKQ